MELSYTLFDQTAQALGLPLPGGEPMRRHTTFQIGGPADRFVTVETLPQLKGLLSAWRHGPALPGAGEGLQPAGVRQGHPGGGAAAFRGA